MTTIAPPASRNDPCPCGSGKRYKHCHGSDTQAPPAAVADPGTHDDPVARARAALRAGRHEDAAALVADIADAGDPGATRVLAEALRASDPEASRARWEQVLATAPGDAEALFFLGEFAREAGDHPLAVSRFEQALEAAPDHPALLNSLGLALEKQGEHARAETCYETVLAAAPDDFNAIANLAQNLYQQRRFKEAIPWFDRVIERMPAAPAAIWANRGVCFRLSGNPGSAEQSLDRATRLAPDEAGPWRDLGFVRTELKNFGAASLAFGRVLDLDPGDVSAVSMLLHVGCYECVWDEHAGRVASTSAAALRLPEDTGAMDPRELIVPFAFTTINDDPAAERRVARAWARGESLPVHNPRPPRRAADGRLRLGFLSPDFHGHPVGRLIVGLFERLDRNRFEIIAYDTGKERRDAIRQRIVAASSRFRSFPAFDAQEIAAAVRADGIDVAFDLTGYTAHSVISALAQRPAPVQVNFLGYTGTLGSPAIDWIIADSFCVPPGSEEDYDERVLRVDPCYLPSDMTRTLDPAVPGRAEYKLPEDAFVFCVAMSPYKIMPERFDAWLRILAAVEGSVMWLRMMNSPAAGRLAARAESAGIDPSRLRYAPNVPVPRYLARFRLADLFLDTAPFGSHTTVNDALFAGLPVLTQAGRTFMSRASASQVIAAGMPELVATSLDEYVETAIALGRDRTRTAALAERLRARRDTLPLFDADAYARRFAEAVERAWRDTPLD